MTSGSINNNIRTLLGKPTAITAKIAIKYLCENIEESINNPDFFKIDYEKYGKQIISESSISDSKKEEIRKQFLNPQPPIQTEPTVVASNIPKPVIQAQTEEEDNALFEGIDYTNTKCASCGDSIANDAHIYDGNPYHQHCVKCLICGRTLLKTDQPDDFVCITTGLFLCLQHYNQYLVTHQIPQKFLSKYNERNKKNFIEELFPSKDKLNGSIAVKPPYEYFVPTVTFHFDKELETVDLKEFREIIGDEAVIIDVDRGSFLVTLAIIKDYVLDKLDKFSEIKEKVKKSVKNLEEKITSLGKAIVGNRLGTVITTPDEKKIDELYQKPSVNVLQNHEEFNNIEMKDMLDYVIKDLNSKKNDVADLEFIRDNCQMFKDAEERIKIDIREDPMELIVIGQTIIPNKLLKEMNVKKSTIEEDDLCEKFLYHGSSIEGNFGIVKSGFRPGANNVFGIGIYATSTLHSALSYAFSRGKKNGIGFVLMCKTFYSKKNMIQQSSGLKNCELSQDVKNYFGINYVEKKDYYVFPNYEQIVPIYSFKIMKADHMIVWKDDHIDNSENSSYRKYLSEKMQVNVYGVKTLEEAEKIIKLKSKNRIKLITNAGALDPVTNTCSGSILITKARSIIHSNFICLVFTGNLNHFNWVSKMENVLMTTNPKDFREFASLEMNDQSLSDFVQKLENQYHRKFLIDKSSWLKFHNPKSKH